MKKTLFFILNILGYIPCLFSQSDKKCGTDLYFDGLLRNVPEIQAQYSSRRRGMFTSNPTDTIFIPVVVHVIHNGEPIGIGTNISDAQILSQIRILNDDYSNSNGTGKDDALIRFCLATKDPLGYATHGITRKQGNKTFYIPYDNLGNPIDNNALKSYDRWAGDYLNIWVADIRSQMANNVLCGYSTFPFATTSADDGVVIGYQFFGDIGAASSSSPFELGKTAVHEVGHWLGLFHIFQKTIVNNVSTRCVNNNCATDGDEVCDTPPVPGEAFADPLVNAVGYCAFRSDCNGNLISAENYMDYNYDRCQKAFTLGQITRMHNMLLNHRNGIYSNSVNRPAGVLFPYACNAPSHCENGVLDQGEVGVDCGGTCPPCAPPGGYGPAAQYVISCTPLSHTLVIDPCLKGGSGGFRHLYAQKQILAGGDGFYQIGKAELFTEVTKLLPGFKSIATTDVSLVIHAVIMKDDYLATDPTNCPSSTDDPCLGGGRYANPEALTYPSTPISRSQVEKGMLLNSFDLYPNPFTNSLKIEYFLTQDAYIDIEIMDIIGNKRSKIVNHAYYPGGNSNITYETADLAAGVYIISVKGVTMTGGEVFNANKKMIKVD